MEKLKKAEEVCGRQVYDKISAEQDNLFLFSVRENRQSEEGREENS